MATSSNDDQGSWTKVERKKRKNGPQSLGNRNSEDSGNPSRGMRVRDRNVRHGGGYTRTALPGNAGTNREFRAGMAGTIGNEQAAAGGSTSDISKLPGANSYNQNSSVTKESYLSVDAIPRAASLISKPQSNMKHPSTNSGSDLGRDHTPSETFGSNRSFLSHHRGGKLHQVVGHQKVLDEGEENDATKQATSITESSRRPAILAGGSQQATPEETSYDLEDPPITSASSSATTSLPLVQRGHPLAPPSGTPLAPAPGGASATPLGPGPPGPPLGPGPPGPPPTPPTPHLAQLPTHYWTVIRPDNVEFLNLNTKTVAEQCHLTEAEEKIISSVRMKHPSYILPRTGFTVVVLPEIFCIIGRRQTYLRHDKPVSHLSYDRLVEFAKKVPKKWSCPGRCPGRFDLHVMEFMFDYTLERLDHEKSTLGVSQRGDVHPEAVAGIKDFIWKSGNIKQAAEKCVDIFREERVKGCYMPYFISCCEDTIRELSKVVEQAEQNLVQRDARREKILLNATFGNVLAAFVGVIATLSVGLTGRGSGNWRTALLSAAGVTAVGFFVYWLKGCMGFRS